MPHRGGIKMAYREWSVIKRPQKIGFYVYNACRCLSEGIQHIRYMKTFFTSFGSMTCISDTV